MILGQKVNASNVSDYTGAYDENGVPDATNAAWGIVTDFKEIATGLSEHKTRDNLRKKGAFAISVEAEASPMIKADGRESLDKLQIKNHH